MNIRKSLVLAIMFFSIQLFSQEAEKEKSILENMKFGIKAGYDMNPLVTDISLIKDQIRINGVQIGFFAKYGNILYAQPEFYYTEYSPIIDNIHQNYKIKGFILPIMFGVKLLDIEILSLRMMTGPSFAYDLKGQAPIENNSRFRFLWQLGAGFDIFDFITFDLRYSLLKGVNISNQISDFNSETNILNLTLGLKY